MGKRVWNEGQVITALCLWEAWLEMESNGNTDADLKKQMENIRDWVGSFTLRASMVDLVEDCDAAFDAADALGEAESFDFDFCPDFLQGCIASGRLDEAVRRQFA